MVNLSEMLSEKNRDPNYQGETNFGLPGNPHVQGKSVLMSENVHICS